MVCAFDVLEHIEDDRLAIQEWIRWLAPNGKTILSVPAHRSRWGAGDVWAGHYRRYDRNDVEQLLVSCGMEVRSEEHTSELQSLMRISYAFFFLKNKTTIINTFIIHH